MKEEEIKKQIAEILRANIHYSPQLENYVIHGAIEAIWKLMQEYAAQSAPKESAGVLKTIDELTEDDLIELWVAIGGTPHLFEYGKDDLKRTLITGETVDKNDEPNGLQLDYYTMASIVDTLRERGFQTLNTPIP